MKHRGHGEASYRERRPGKWEGRIRINYKQYSVYGNSRKECVEKISNLKKKVDRGILPSKKTNTYSEWLDFWLSDVVYIKNEPSTYDNYKSLVDNHLKKEIGNIKIDKLKQSDIQKLIRKKIDAGLSTSTINLIHHVCRVSLNYAVDTNVIFANPALHVIKPKRQNREMHTISPENVSKLKSLGAVIRQKERMFSCFLFMIYTGLRRGEVLGLKWADINIEESYLVLQRAITKTSSKGIIITDGKTDRARRFVPIPHSAMQELLLFRDLQNKEKAALEKLYVDKDWIFCREDGKPYYPTSLRKILLRILKYADIPAIRIHDTRHTFATLLLLVGENPKTVQELLGHANVSTTLGKYSHVDPGLKKDAMNRLDNFVE